MSTDNFYSGLPVIEQFSGLTDPESFTPLPLDWHVAVADIRNSTEAIVRGSYKEVNVMGAAVLMAGLNAAGDIEIPYAYGGDGAVLALPPSLLEQIESALLGCRDLARDRFGFDLHVGTVPLREIYRDGAVLYVARYRLSEHSVQAVFSGDGLSYAEEKIKREGWAPSLAKFGRADMRGLECRWQDIPAPKDELICLIVQALGPESNWHRVYRELIEGLLKIYGSEEALNPVYIENLKLTNDPRRLKAETLLRAGSAGFLDRLRYGLGLQALVLAGRYLMRKGIRGWGSYKRVLIRNTDFRRFVESYRQVLSGTAEQRMRLMIFLEERCRRGDLVYGMHITDRAHITCLVFDYIGRHLHFLDGADGGFALAAKDLKKRRRALKDAGLYSDNKTPMPD